MITLNRIILFFSLSFFLVSRAFALDTSYSTGSDYNTKTDKQISLKKGKSKSTSAKNSDSKAKSKSSSSELTFDTYAVYVTLASACVQHPKVAVNFDLTTVVDDDTINLNLSEWYDNIAKNNQPIAKADMDEEKFKKYVGCLAYNGAKMAQANIILSKEANKNGLTLSMLELLTKKAFLSSAKISDTAIKAQLKMVAKSLNDGCTFMGSTDKIKCGSLIFTFSQNQLQIGNEIIYGYNTMFGVSSQMRVSVNSSQTHTDDTSTDTTSTFNKDISISQDSSDTNSNSTKQDAAIGKYVPGLQ